MTQTYGTGAGAGEISQPPMRPSDGADAQQPFLWHPWLYHYGRNWGVPGDRTYTLRVRVEPPEFPWHDKINGKRYQQPVEVEFRGVRIKTGQKKS